MQETGADPLRILIVCEHASNVFGGEAILPWHYFAFLRAKAVDVHLISHARSRQELVTSFPNDLTRLHFVEDTAFDKILAATASRIPARLAYVTVGLASRFRTQLAAKRLARQLISTLHIQLVHQPIPVSPRDPSFMYGFGVPVVIGPLNGNMTYPPAFVQSTGRLYDALFEVARSVSTLLNFIIPGKRNAAALIYANERTRRALPKSRGQCIHLVENGVDLGTFRPRRFFEPSSRRFIFVGRLVGWKMVEVLLEALSRTQCTELLIVGDGPERQSLEALTKKLLIADRVDFVGWKSQAECSEWLAASAGLLLPSIYECGGAVVLEAMACGIPVIATEWGGPADYLDATCGFLVKPISREHMVKEFARLMDLIASDPPLRESLGAAGSARAQGSFNWEHKVQRIIEIYASAIDRAESQQSESTPMKRSWSRAQISREDAGENR